MSRYIQLPIALMIMGLLFLGIHELVYSTGESTAEPTAEATKAEFIGKIAFVSETSNDTQIYIMNADGSNVRQLTNDDRFGWSPALSPDGQQIAFVANVDKHYQLFVMNVDGTNEKQLTYITTGQNGVTGLDWSPDGKKIVFAYKLSDDPDIQTSELQVINADGSSESRITPYKMEAIGSPHWSPTGDEIVFDSKGKSPKGTPNAPPDNGTSHLYIINADGSNLHRLSQRDCVEVFPAWSPDGKSIVFLTCKSSNEVGLFSTNSSGTILVQLTSTFYTMTTWSPDGKYLAAVLPEDRNGKRISNIFVMNADGSNPIKLTDTDQQYKLPTWSK